MFKKGICVIVPLFDITLCLLMLHSFKTTSFSPSSIVTSQGEDDDLMVYTISSPVPTPAPISVPIPVKHPITQVYSRRQNPLVSSPTLVASSSYPIHNDDLSIALHKGKH